MSAPYPPERQFPMLDGPPIPWSLAEIIYAGYIKCGGSGQSLERVGERGGFGWEEVAHIWRTYPNAKAAIQAVIDQRAKEAQRIAEFQGALDEGDIE